MFRHGRGKPYRWRGQHRRLPRLPRNLYRVLALAVFWLTVAPVATYLVSGQAGGPTQATTPVATSSPSPAPLTATAPQTANTAATTAQPPGVQGNSPRWAAATVTSSPADVPGASTVNPQTSNAVLTVTEPLGLAGLVTPRNVSFTAVTTSPLGNMPAISSQSVLIGAPAVVKPDTDLPGANGTHTWYSGQFKVDLNADGTPDPVYFVLTVVSATGATVALDLSSDDADFGETAGGSLTNGITGANDDERITASGALVRLGSFYTFVVGFPTSPLATWSQQAKQVASDAAPNDYFGRWAVDVSGDTMVVGADGDDNAGGVDAGSAYVFVRSGTTWSQQAKLTASDAATGDSFGRSVGVSGDTIVVGAYLDDNPGVADAGSAYVFVRSGTAWSQQAKLTASDAAFRDHFGWSVAIDGDTIVVGASNDYGTPGGGEAAYVFVRSGATWSQQAKLTASDAAANDYFGVSVAIDGDTIVVGAYMDDNSGVNNAGSAYVFVRPAGGWNNATQTAKLIPSDPDPIEAGWFGWSVGVSGDTIVVGAQADDIAGTTNVGSAYVFVRPGGGWSDATQTAKLTASDGAGLDDFGSSVAIEGDTIVVGADADDNAGGVDAGAAYVFVRNGTTWGQQAKLTASDAGGNRSGYPMAFSGDTVVVGTLYGESAYVFVGSATSASASVTSSTWYVATVTSTDLDGDGAADDTFYAAITDINSDGIYDRLDLSVGDNVFGEGDLGDGIVDYSATDNANDERVSAAANVKMGVNTFYLSFDATPGGAVASGEAWAWGNNSEGQLGDGTTIQRNAPVQVSGLAGVTDVAGGGWHSLALSSAGTVWAWGWNDQGQLGDGTTTGRTTPVQVSGLTGVAAVAVGDYYHSLALKSDGTVWAWGWNYHGQLGDGTTTDRHTPVPVSGLTGVVAIAAGGYHSLALKSDGTVWAWGGNDNGQLGDDTQTNRTTPVQVSGLTDVTAIAAGGYYSLALKSDGTVWAWGRNVVGELGDGTTTGRTTPVQVSGLTGATAIAAGGYHSLALKSDGAVWAWGYNNHGQLGDGTTTNRHTPVQVSGLTGVTTFAAGGLHSLALRSDGTVWAWGYNNNGQLGDGSTTNRHTPVPVSGLTGVTAIAAGPFHGLAVKATALAAGPMHLSSTWWTAGLTLDANANGNKTDAVDTLYYVLTDLDSDGVYDRLDLSLGNDTFAQGGNLGNALVSVSDDDERLLASDGLARDVTLGAYKFVVSFVRNPGSASVVADVSIQAKTWYKGTFTIDVDANGLANDTVSFVLSDTDSDGLYDTMDLSTNDADYGDGDRANQQTGSDNDESVASGEDVRLGDHYTFTTAFVSNPGGVANDASITSRTWFTGSFTIDSDGDESADDTAYFVLSDTDSDGRYDTMDVSTDDAALGEGTLSGQVPLQTGANDDERLGMFNSGGSAVVRLGLHVFTVAFDNNPAAPAHTDDARLTSRWYAGTLDGLPFVQVSPTSNGLHTVIEFDANGSNAYGANEVFAASPATVTIGGSQFTIAWRSNPTVASSATLTASGGGQGAAPAANPSNLLNSAPSAAPPASEVLAKEAEQAQKEADAQEGQESTQPIPPQAAEPPPARITRDITSQPLAGDEVVVVMSPDLPDAERRIRQIAFATGATIVGSVAATRTYQLQFPVADLTALDRVIARLEGFTGVASASHHYLLDELSRTPNDSKYPSWGEPSPEGWDLRLMQAPEAWNATTGSPSVRIAVIDADFDRNHEDLRDNVTSISAPKRTKAGGHGTHVSGTICAKGDNAVGVAGVVWDCSLSLYDFGGASPVKAQEAMIAAVQSGARIINMSLQWVDNNQCGTVGTPGTSKKVEEVNNILKGALDYAKRERRDVLWVFAAGNECRDTRYASPASLVRTYPENVIVVSSIGPSGDLSYFSNYGDMVTVVAPGEDILSTLPSNSYGLLSGTSMATPHVSGLAALIMSRSPALTAIQVKQCITGSAGSSSRNHSYKLVNAAEAVRCGEALQTPGTQKVFGGG
ncbi:MAG: S8 family serine peptidase [Chloroflexi bacterium]|nr:S8 family serine peptidase [Chloroflexota bacterium]